MVIQIYQRQTYYWYKSFKKGRGVVEDLPPSGRSTSVTEEVKKIVLENGYSSLREIGRHLNIGQCRQWICSKRVDFLQEKFW